MMASLEEFDLPEKDSFSSRPAASPAGFLDLPLWPEDG